MNQILSGEQELLLPVLAVVSSLHLLEVSGALVGLNLVKQVGLRPCKSRVVSASKMSGLEVSCFALDLLVDENAVIVLAGVDLVVFHGQLRKMDSGFQPAFEHVLGQLDA